MSVKNFFGGIGKIVVSGNYCTFRVDSLKQIFDVIIPHFDQYPPVTHKLPDYILSRGVVNIMNNKEHLTPEGLNKVLSIKASLNLGLSEVLKASFTQIKPVLRPLIVDKQIPNPY